MENVHIYNNSIDSSKALNSVPDIPAAASARAEASGLQLIRNEQQALTLTDGRIFLTADFNDSLKRLKPNLLNRELLVRAARLKGCNAPTAIDATAGLGEDSVLLAAAGFNITLYEYDPVIAALLEDAMMRAASSPELSEIISRMRLINADSIDAMTKLNASPDVIVLDPMFPERRKSSLIKKKFQLLQKLESPCCNEAELLDAALSAHPRKIVIKRPLNADFLAGRRPSYLIKGSTIRYDCILPSV